MSNPMSNVHADDNDVDEDDDLDDDDDDLDGDVGGIVIKKEFDDRPKIVKKEKGEEITFFLFHLYSRNLLLTLRQMIVS